MIAKPLQKTFEFALNDAIQRRHEYVTLEHLLYALLHDRDAAKVIRECGGDVDMLMKQLDDFMNRTLEKMPDDGEVQPVLTAMLQRVIQYAQLHAQSSGRKEVDTGQMLAALYQAERSQAVYLLRSQGVNKLDVLNYLSHGIAKTPAGVPKPAFIGGDEDQEVSGDPLKHFAVNLIERAKKGEIDPLIGRSLELERTIQILCRRRKNNPLFVGEPGVGKTAIAEGLALKIHKNEVPAVLKDAEVYSLDMGAVLAGTKYRGEFEQRLKALISALLEKKDAILFIDEIHTIVGAGAVSGGTMDASNILKPAIASGKLRCIGSTTYAEYKASFERDRALARRFQKIEIGEPTVAETIEILHGLKNYYQEHHHVTFTDDAIKLAAELSAKYIHDRHLPDKAIDVLDEAGARVRMLGSPTTTIGEAEVETVVSRMAKIPPRTIAVSEKERLQNLERDLQNVIFGQDHAIKQIANAIKLSRSGLGHVEKPIGSFLFSGPTGVGKTELAKQLALSLGVEFIRFDMSEYMEPHT
ncbi:MAG TPA: AAA family ATPase, partial [Thermoanaerobaculia bacterium]|nr:AAA family ATPase [Thermoanaerobaculia bacterium]